MQVESVEVQKHSFSLTQKYWKADRIVKCYNIAGRHIKINFLTQELCQQLAPALAHLSSPEEQSPDLTIDVLEGEESANYLPFPKGSSADYIAKSPGPWGVNLRSGDAGLPKMLGMPPPNEYLSWLDPNQKHAIQWYRNALEIPYYERGAPLRTLFDWWLDAQNLVFTHGAAIGTGNSGALIVGKGGRGKSTTAISCLRSERLNYIGDDYVALDASGPIVAHSVYSSGKLEADHIVDKLPQLLPCVDNPKTMVEEKGLFFFYPSHKEKLKPSTRLTCAILPVVGGGKDTTFKMVGAGKLLLGLASSTIYQSTSVSSHALGILTQTLAGLPCYELHVGTDLDKIPPVVEELIAKHEET